MTIETDTRTKSSTTLRSGAHTHADWGFHYTLPGLRASARGQVIVPEKARFVCRCLMDIPPFQKGGNQPQTARKGGVSSSSSRVSVVVNWWIPQNCTLQEAWNTNRHPHSSIVEESLLQTHTPLPVFLLVFSWFSGEVILFD